MKRFFLFLSVCLLLLPFVQAQKVGLVLSGGGAKGMTHIGIIRALEENNIPIDYITGTSMGAIIGSLYAMGYSPDDMEALLRSEDFKRWYSGQVEPEYGYYFKQNRPTPEFFNIRFSFKDSLHIQASDTSYKHGKSHPDESGLCGAIRTGYGCMQRRFQPPVRAFPVYRLRCI